MIAAKPSHRQRVTSIIEESFQNNPSVVSVVNPKKPNSLKALAEYSFDTAIVRDGVFLSDNQEAVAICYRYNAKKEGLRDFWHQFLLVLRCIGISRVLSVMKRESYLKKIRPKDGRFLYFWFFGSTNNGKKNGAAKELKKGIFELSEKNKLPIYLETSVEKNRRVYEYFGFETYHEWDQPRGKTLYFMRRSPN